MAREQNNPCYILRAGYWGVAKLVPARSAGLGKFNRQSCCKDALRELYQGFLVDEDFGEAMGIDFFNGRGVGFGMLAVSSVRLFFPQVLLLCRWNRAKFCFVHIAWVIRVRMYVICVFHNCNGFWQLLRLCCFIFLWLLYLCFQHYCSLKWKVGITLGGIESI